jgi:hypothetical protein
MRLSDPYASKYNTLVPRPPRNLLAVQVLQQRDGVFACDARKFLEYSDWQTRAAFLAVFCQRFAQLQQRIAVKHQVARDLHQHFFAQQDLQNFLGARRVHR